MADRKIVAAEMAALKDKVKAEMLRRKYNGNMAAYAAAVYDYTVAPSAGSLPLTEHFNKVRDPLAAVNSTGVPAVVTAPAPARESDMTALEAKLALFQSKAVIGGTSDCAALCSGMCVNNCASNCTSCTGCTSCTSCTGTCSSCSGCSGCSGGCSGGCDGSCWGDCAEGCGWGYCSGGTSSY